MKFSPHPFLSSLIKDQAHLRIVQTTDIHAQIFPYDYYNDRPVAGLGLAHTAGLISKARRGAANSLLLDNGDILQGSALGDYMAFDRGMTMGDLHPVIAAMNAVGYDAATLGNHEFNYGLDFLQASIAGAKFPFVSANALIKRGAIVAEDVHLVPPYVLLDRQITCADGTVHPIKIGVLGLLPPQIVTWDEASLRGAIQTRDILETATAMIPEMRAAGADIVVLLAHTGLAEKLHFDGMENAGQPLARLAGVDALVVGHMHMLFPSAQFADVSGCDIRRGTIAGTPAVMAGFWGSHLGVIDLKLQRENGDWVVLDGGGQVVAMPKDKPTKPVQRVLKAAQREHDATLEYMRFPIGATTRPLHSYFAMIRNCASVQIICRAQSRFVAEKLAGTEHADLPLLSAAAPFKVGGWTGPDNYTDIPAGPMYQRSVADLYCFPNTICALRLRGADIVEWLERSAAAFHRVTPGKPDQVLLNDDFPSYNFDVLFGLTYKIDPTQPARYSTQGALVDSTAHRITDLRYKGQPIDLEAEFMVATNNYRASTYAAIRAENAAQVAFESSVTVRNVLLNEIADASPLDFEVEENWRFVQMPWTSFVFETSPKAARYLVGREGAVMETLGVTDTGFARFRLRG